MRYEHAGGSLAGEVRDALSHLFDVPYLQSHPLAARLDAATAGAEQAEGGAGTSGRGRARTLGERLRERLLAAIEAVRPDEHGARSERALRAYRLLRLRYVDGLDTAGVRRELGLGKTQYHAEQGRALHQVVTHLERELERAEKRPSVGDANELRDRLASGNPPQPRTPFIGRARELGRLASLLGHGAEDRPGRRLDAQVRLVTLLGTAGTGKTRLAARYFEEVTAAGGLACFVDLTATAEAPAVMAAIARALGVAVPPEKRPLEALGEALRVEWLLLVLDNCEHVLGAAPEIGALLSKCPRVRVLATSRAPLGLAGEHELQVPPLAVPDEDVNPALEEVAQAEAVRLFVQQARLVDAGFALIEENAAAVAGICRRLDGLPLAIELAAARVRLLDPASLLARLDRRLALLVGGPRDAPARHKTLRAALDWSYRLLSPGEQRVFRALGVFAGGFTPEAAQAVAMPDSGTAACILCLEALVARSLVQRTGGGRLGLLQTMQEHARELLDSHGEREAMRRRHGTYYLNLVVAWKAGATTSPLSLAQRVEVEAENVNAALAWAVDAGEAELGLNAAVALEDYWAHFGAFVQTAGWLSRLLALPEAAARSPTRARALGALGASLHRLRRHDEALAVLLECQAIARERSEPVAAARALRSIGQIQLDRGEIEAARESFEQCLAIGRSAGLPLYVAHALAQLGSVAGRSNDLHSADVLLAEAVEIAGTAGLRGLVSQIVYERGAVAFLRGDNALAAALLSESVMMCQERRADLGVAFGVLILGAVAGAAGEHERAVRLVSAGLGMLERMALEPDPIEVQITDETLAAARWARSGLAASGTRGRRCPKTRRSRLRSAPRRPSA